MRGVSACLTNTRTEPLAQTLQNALVFTLANSNEFEISGFILLLQRVMELDLAAEPFLLPLELCPTRAHTRLTPRGISVSLQHSCCHPHVQVLAWDLQYGTCNILCLLNLTGNNGSTNSVGIPPWSCTCILGDSLLCACLSLLANSWGG